MRNIQEYKRQIEGLETLQNLSAAMRDLAAARLKDLSERFQRNIDFYEELSKSYGNVERQMAEYRKKTKITTYKKPRAAVAVTSNHRFYGSLNKDVMELFLAGWDSTEDHFVIGVFGQDYLKNRAPEKKFTAINFTEDNPERYEMQKIISLAKSYDKVLVCYPNYRNLFYQEPLILDLSFVAKSDADTAIDDYIFEPELPIIHDFFSTQIKFLLLQRVMLETDLARTAARLIKMHGAEVTAENKLVESRRGMRKTIQTQLDLRLFESITGFKKWK